MNKCVFIILLLIGTNACGQATLKTAQSPIAFVPAGYVVSEELQGDLNKDNQADYVLIIKGTNKHNFVKDEYCGELDLNRRGIIIAIKNKDHYELAIGNRDGLPSEDIDAGAYYTPELDVSINEGNLLVHYSDGREIYWTYNFRYHNSDFELIGCDLSEGRGPVVEREISINLLTKRMLIIKNVNQDAEDSGDEKVSETWKQFTLAKPIKLKDIANFDNCDVESLLGLVK